MRKRLLSLLLVLCMLLSLLPGTALAAVGDLLNNSPAENQSLLEQLEGFTGESYEEAYELLESLGLLDEDGNLITDRTIDLDGQAYTLEEMEALLNDPDTDLTQVAEVDGVPIALGDLATIVAIERELARIRETYFSGKTFEGEALTNLNSLMAQLQSEGMTLSADPRSATPLAVFNTSNVQKSGSVSYMAANVAGLTDGQKIQITIRPVRTDAFNAMPASARQITAGFSSDSAGSNKLASATVTLNSDNEVTVTYTLKKSDLQNNTLYLFVSPNISASEITVDLKKSDGYKNYSFGTIAACLSFTAAEGCAFQAADGGQSDRWNFYHDTSFALPLSMTSTGSTSNLTASRTGSADVRFKLHSHDLPVNETFLFLQACKGNGYYNVAIDKDTAVRVKTTATISHTNQYYEGNQKVDNYPLMCDLYFFLGNQNNIQRNNIIENTVTGFPINLSANTDGTISFESTIYSVNDLDLNAFVYCMVPYVIISARKDAANSTSTVNMANYTTTTKSATFELVDDTFGPNLTVTAPGGTYRSGDVIPIKITGDEYIKAPNMNTKITINGNQYSLSDLHASSNGKYISLLYEVQEFDSQSLTVAIPRGCFTDYWGNQSAEVNGEGVSGVSIRSPLLKNAVTGLSASYDATAQTLGVTISVDQAEGYQMLYKNYLDTNPTGAMQLRISVDNKAVVTHPVTVGGSGNTYTFTAEPYSIPRVKAAQSVTVQLQVDNGSGGWETVGRFSASDTVPALVEVTGVNVGIVGGSTNTNLTLSDTTVPKLQATVTPSDATYKTGVWSSDNPDVATIDQSGQITLTGKAVGDVSFTYTADNGTPEDKTDDVTSDPLKFTVTAGDELTLVFPAYAQDSLVREGNSATVKWNTNALVYYPDQTITFTVDLYKGGSATGQPVYTGTAVDQAELTIPADKLTAVYPQSQYTVKVSMTSPEPREDTASITVLSPPTVMGITADSTSITDGKTLALDCTISNAGATGTLSAKRMTEEGAAATDADGCLSATSVTGGGTVTFTPQKVTDGLYDTYTITFTEDRNSPDVAPSTDSIVVTVYRSGALNILVDGEDKDTIDLSNVGKVNGSNGELPTDSAAIIALRQELGLIEYVSINADAYNWSSVSDGIKWVSQNPDAVSVNYRQGGLWDNIKDLPYETYLPNSQMAVSATADGSATVTATHAATGMSDSVTVNVKTLRQQFYLFQVTPAGETQVSYTNGDGDEIKVHTNADGLLALYEPSGIKSDVVFSAGDESNPYLGTILKENLASGEKDAAKLQLYPLNTVTLHPAALAEVYLVKPDGSPYANQTVTLRGGVYMVGRYVEDALLGNNQNSLQRGDEDATYTTDSDGKLTVYMDAAQFVPDGYTGQLTNADLSYWFELSDIGSDRYYPTLVNIQGSMSPDYKLRTGSAVITLREVPGGEEEQPFLIAQTLSYGKDSGDALRARSVMGSTGKVGPNSTYKYTELTSRVMLWGVEEEKGASTVTMTGEGGFVPAEQSVDINTFPFASIPIITNTLVLTEETMTASGWLEAEVPESLTASVYQNGALQKTVTMPFQVVDLTHVPLVDADAEALVVEMTGSFTGSVGHNDFSFGDNRVGSAFSGDVTDMLSVLNSLQETGSPLFRVLITPSEDSSVFNVLIWGGYNSLDMDDFDYSESGFSTGYSLMEAELDVGVPPLNDLSDMAQGAYDPIGSINEAQPSRTNSGLDIGAQLEGYYEGQFYYDTDQHKWAFRTISGGMTAGASLSFQANVNAWAGPVPVTATFAAGIALQLDFKAATVYKDQVDDTSGWTAEALKADSVNDYLTTLRIQGYIDAFGGLGFDYSVLALKIGLYGRLTADSTNTFLSRTYLKDKSQLNGQALGISGEVGIKFYAKFLFVSYEAVIGSGSITYSETFNDYDYIDSYWNGSSAGGASLINMGAPTLLSRAYLTAYANSASQRWISGTASFDSDAAVVQNDANPGSEPTVNDDGSLSVYISDRNSDDYFDSRVMAGSVGTEGTVIHDDGFGDMSPSLSGDSGFTVAAWVRLFEDLDKQSGEKISPAEEKQLLNSTEIMVATTTNGTNWAAVQLTDNASPDLAPVTAANGSGAIVFWRSVYASDENNLTDFNTQDAIYFSRYNGSGWDEAQMAYNGSLGSVVGLQSAMLSDGTAILAFTIDKTGAPDATGYEMAYRTVSADGALGDLVVLTSDSETDTNPQATAVSQGFFVLGWYSSRSGGDIRLQAVGANGQLYTGSHEHAVPESASAIIGESDLAVSADFRFAKGVSQSVDGLTLVWAETEDVVDRTTGTATPDHSVLYGAQLCEIDDTMYLSSPQPLITLPNRTISNSFAAWKSGNEVRAYIFGTWYDPDNDDDTYKQQGLSVPEDTDQLLTGGGTMRTSDLVVEKIVVDYQNLQTDAWTPVTFTLRNTGTTKLTDLTVTVGTYSSAPVTLYPGQSATALVSYKTGDSIVNPTYTISASGGQITNGTLHLNYNDVGISSMQVVSEGGGKRTVQVTLYNDAAAKLAGSGRTVELSFYTDLAYTQPANITVGSQTGVSSSGNKVTLSGDDVLRRMDQGSMTLQVTYDLEGYVTGTLSQDEVPASGVQLYAMAQIREDGDVVPEFATGNNMTSVQLTGAYARTGKVTDLDVSLSNDDVTTATVTLKNNSLQPQQNKGTLVAVLLDQQGKELETKIVTPDTALACEETQNVTVTFSQLGADVALLYSTATAAAGLQELRFSGLSVGLSDFVLVEDPEDPNFGNYVCTLPDNAPTSTVVTFISGDKVTVNGTEYDRAGSAEVSIPTGDSTITVTSGGETYILNLNRTRSGYRITVESGQYGKVTSSRTTAGRGATVTLTAVPEEGCHLAGLTVTDRNGNAVEVKDKGEGKYTFTMPSSAVTVKAVFVPDDLPFTDVPAGAWYEEGVRYAYQKGMMNGTSATTFEPETTTSRGMIVTILWRLAGSPAADDPVSFTDVDPSAWYGEAVRWAAGQGIVSGYGNGKFGPNDPITREQLSVMLWRYAEHQEYDVSVGENTNILSYTDVGQLGEYAVSAMQWAVGAGIINGTGDGSTLSPLGSATRAQAAVMLMRFCQEYVSW